MSTTPPTDLLDRLRSALSGQYRIERKLGQGGMGTVYLAQDLSLDRPVAIKVISPDVSTSSDIRERFVLEAKTVARLRHPNIVSVYAAGEADGLLYFVMEFVPGESLRERLTREQQLPVDDANGILRDVASALDHAHQAELVHRDVKPENVLLDRESGRAMLTDFGVARAIAGDGRLTGAGFVLGSPQYMSPEQAAGESNLDGRSDLYSLGLIGYEMLSGVPAMEGPSAAAILAKQLTVTPPPLVEKNAAVPVELSATIERLLRKSPDERFQRGAEVIASLAGEVFDAATPVRHIGRARATNRVRATARPRSQWVIGGTVAALAAVAGIFWFRNAQPATNDKAWLVAPFEIQGADRSIEWLREGSLNMLTLSLAQWNDLRVVEYERTLDLLREAKIADGARVGLEDARGLAAGVGAGRVVIGQVTTVGDSIVVTASLFDVKSGSSKDRARAAGLTGSDPRPLFESVATQLLDLVGAPRITMDLAKHTTGSVVAYRHYLDGLRHLNAWRIRAADSAFDRAIAIDSTFALAYFRKSVALGWELSPDTMRMIAAEKAVALSDRLPPHWQELVRGHAELTRGFVAMSLGDTSSIASNFVASRNRFARLVANDSTDAEAWFSLADADYHLIWNSSYGRSPDSTAKYLNESLYGFRRTIELDPSFHLAYQHLVEMYNQAGTDRSFLVLVGDTIRAGGPEAYERRIGSADYVKQLRQVAQQRGRVAAIGWIAADPDASAARRVLAESYLAANQADSAISVLQEALKRPSTALAQFEWMIPMIKARAGMPNAGPEIQSAMARVSTDSMRRYNVGIRLQALLGAMTVGAITGMPSVIDSAGKALMATTPTMPGGGDIPSAYLVSWFGAAMKTAMGIPITPAIRSQLLNAASGMEKIPNATRDPSVPYQMFLATRDTVFGRMAQRWMAGTGVSNPLPELTALIALAQHDTATATDIAKTIPSPDSLRKVTLSMTGMRTIARAEVLAELGNTRAALALYETIDPSRFPAMSFPEPSWPIYVRSYLARGRLYELIGERDKAIGAYEKFLALWADAEQPMHAQLREAREAIARIKENPSVPVKGAARGSN